MSARGTLWRYAARVAMVKLGATGDFGYCSIDQARRRIREALSLWVDNAEDAVIEEEIRLPAAARQALQRAERARARADLERSRAQEETERTARALLDDLGIGMRDAGELLGISHQRVQQLVKR